MQITRREARNFAWGIMLLPRPKRQALGALYAFARRVDDIADGDLDPVEKRTRLENCEQQIESLPWNPDGDPVLVALGDTMVRYPVPKSALRDLVAGGLMDIDQNRYATWPELREYCRHVAGAVGLACCAVYGPTDPVRAAHLAQTLGLALQQINIMRDVPEDWGLGRVYLPQEELARFGVSESDIADARLTAGWQRLMELQAARARSLLTQGLGLLTLLDRRSTMCVRAFVGIYAGLLKQMEEHDFDVFSTRPRLSPVSKARAVSGL